MYHFLVQTTSVDVILVSDALVCGHPKFDEVFASAPPAFLDNLVVDGTFTWGDVPPGHRIGLYYRRNRLPANMAAPEAAPQRGSRIAQNVYQNSQRLLGSTAVTTGAIHVGVVNKLPLDTYNSEKPNWMPVVSYLLAGQFKRVHSLLFALFIL
jgi:hypothetical protein